MQVLGRTIGRCYYNLSFRCGEFDYLYISRPNLTFNPAKLFPIVIVSFVVFNLTF